MVYDTVHNRLFVSEADAHRVVVFDMTSITDGEDAQFVLGQPGFYSSSSGTTQSLMNFPRGLGYDQTNERLYVSEVGRNAITIWDVGINPSVASITSPTASGHKLTGATIAIHVNFNENVTVTGTPQLTLETGTTDAVVDYVSGTGTKTLIFNYTVGASHTSDRLDIQSISALALNGGTIKDASANDALLTLNFQTSLGAYKLFKINPHTGIVNGKAASDVIGQYTTTQGYIPSYSNNGGQNSFGSVYPLGLSISSKSDIALDAVNHRLFVVDTSNSRVLVFNLDTNNNLEDKIPDFVLGQAGFNTNTTGNTQSGMNGPVGIAYDATTNRLFVSQTNNHRITVYDVATIVNGENAVNVLGQSLFTTFSSALTSTGLNAPRGLKIDTDNQKLYVADTGNNRVIVYDVTAITDGEPAVSVLGQSLFTTSTAATTQSGMSGPYAIELDVSTNTLYIADRTNNRVTIYDVASITNGEDAVNVLGQPDFVTTSATINQVDVNTPE
jgi:DNA-binding beta-propeller fold protein YncE